MKRDMDLIRQILLALEANSYDGGWLDLAFEGRTAAEVSYHVLLAAEAGLIVAQDLSTLQGPKWAAKRLTSLGHDFLDNARNETVWRTAVERVGGTVGTVSIGVLSEVLKQMVLRAIGLTT